MHAYSSKTMTDAYLDNKRNIGDREADELISLVIKNHSATTAKQLFDRLIREVELPVEDLPLEIQRFVSTHHHIPSWADSAKIKLAQELFIDHGPKFLIFLYFKSLPLLYSMKNGVQVLVKTGRLAHDPDSEIIFTRRIAETGQFLLEVMSPDGFENNKPAVNAALKIRIIHSSIRHFINKSTWNENVLGKPINQEDMAATLMTFSYTMIEGLQQFRIPVTTVEADAYQHFWKLIGFYMGIDEDLLPDSSQDAFYLLSKILERQSAGSEEGVLMTRALTTFVSKRIDSGLLKSSPGILIRYLTGTEIARRIGVRRDKFWWLYYLIPGFLKAWFRIGESLEDRVSELEKFADHASVKIVNAMVNYFDNYKQRSFRIPQALSKSWFDD